MLTLMSLQQHTAPQELRASGSAMTGMGLVGQLVCEEDIVWTSGTRVATVAQCKCKALFGKYITLRLGCYLCEWKSADGPVHPVLREHIGKLSNCQI